MAKQKHLPLQFVAWANIEKWRILRNVSAEQIAGVLGVKKLADRRATGFLTMEEADRICMYLDIEPEKLLER